MSIRRLLAFFGVFALLAAPWPPLDHAYAAWTRMLGKIALGWESARWEIRFERIDRSDGRPLDTRIRLMDRDSPTAGRPTVVGLDLDMRGIGRVPAAFLAALVLASPVSWRRRAKALAIGEIVLEGVVLVALGIHVLGHTIAAPGWALEALDETLINQVGGGFFAALLIWMAVTFRAKDWEALAHAGPKSEGPPRHAPVKLGSKDPISIEA